MKALTDSSLMILEKKIFKIAILLLLIGGLNWLSIGLLKKNLVESFLGKRISRIVYVLVGIAALCLLFNRDTYLPFLGETVLPCSIIPERVPPGATKEVPVSAPPGSKVLYWAAEPSMEGLKEIPTWQEAYNKFENAGVTRTDSTGVAVLRVRNPQPYLVPMKGRLEPHIHYRICNETGMLGRVNTVFVGDE
jgi:uncharacterized membrane protein YuzA (DUF378 family)